MRNVTSDFRIRGDSPAHRRVADVSLVRVLTFLEKLCWYIIDLGCDLDKLYKFLKAFGSTILNNKPASYRLYLHKLEKTSFPVSLCWDADAAHVESYDFTFQNKSFLRRESG